MRPFSRSIIELFDGKRRYLIPLFQRQYVWSADPQLNRIWEDVSTKVEQRLLNQTTFPHFLGAIVIGQVPTFGKQVQSYDVIDGQQRLSTFQILLCAFRDVATRQGSEFAAELQKHIVNDGIMEDKTVERYKLWPTQVDRGQLKAIADEGSPDALAAREKNDFNIKKTGVQPNMIRAYRFFYEKIEQFLGEPRFGHSVEERVEALFSSLKNDLALVSIELEGGDDPQVIFETLNGFGQPLLPSDLLRNYVFQRAYKEKQRAVAGAVESADIKSSEELYTQYWLPLDQPFWKTLEKQGRIKRARIDNFFMHFLAMKKASDINVGRLFHEYRSWVESEQPYSTVESLLRDTSSFADVYQDLLKPSRDGVFYTFSKALTVFDVSTVVPLALFLAGEAKLEGERLESALAMLESFLVRRAICNLTNKAYNRLFIQIIEQIRGAEDVVAALASALSKPKDDAASAVWPDDAMLRANWESKPLYLEMSSGRLQFILGRIETAMRTAKNEDIEIKSAMTVEHLMPVKWWTNWPLPDGRLGKDAVMRSVETNLMGAPVDEESAARDRAVHTIGNLTLLTQELNASVSNGAWLPKKTEILKHSALAISRGIALIEQWDEDQMTVRSKTLFAYAAKIWGPPNAKAALTETVHAGAASPVA
ncbi:DUF262 domain-containing protein [Massilia psychrophila]|uniref:DUF262 domain-containing protein n=1 Tax=Massilia psychrophila TaxID=1603353 RepID=A0A2G8SZJ0_9BURK|nr:DUF262 domain-containing protein [Massilia psychrophila]PIL39206.1 hypothetical protein CR103_14055 [Massilia psychrophila]GGE82036.1 hypothetical protein GCM10008020_28700 [Massilia psychrophila]